MDEVCINCLNGYHDECGGPEKCVCDDESHQTVLNEQAIVEGLLDALNCAADTHDGAFPDIKLDPDDIIVWGDHEDNDKALVIRIGDVEFDVTVKKRKGTNDGRKNV